jgi:hypothetical protein
LEVITFGEEIFLDIPEAVRVALGRVARNLLKTAGERSIIDSGAIFIRSE